MKKIVVLVLAVLMLATMSVGAFAASGAFVESPSKQLAPELVSYDNESEACNAVLVITSYADRGSLDENERGALEDAYDAIASTENLGTLGSDVSALADELGIPVTDFAVSDLFNIGYTDCEPHEEHGSFSVTVRPVTAQNVAAVLQFTMDGWEVIPAKVEDGKVIFEIESPLPAPFAIMTHNGLPASGCCCGWICWLIILLIILLIIIVIVVILRKKKKDNGKDA